MKNTLLIPIFTLFSATLSPAQEATEVVAQPEISLQFTCINSPEFKEIKLLYVAKEGIKKSERIPITLSSARLAPKTSYKGPREFFIFESAVASPEEEPTAKVTLPEGIHSAIILLYPTDEEDATTKFQSIAIDADAKTFPKGSRCFANTTNTSIRGELGKMPFQRGNENNIVFTCESGKTSVVPALDLNSAKHRGHPVILEFEHPENGWLPIAQTRWFHTPEIRHIMVVHRAQNSDRIQLHGILDQSLSKSQNEEPVK